MRSSPKMLFRKQKNDLSLASSEPRPDPLLELSVKSGRPERLSYVFQV